MLLRDAGDGDDVGVLLRDAADGDDVGSS